MIVRIKWILPCRLLLLIIAPRSVKNKGKQQKYIILKEGNRKNA